MDYDPNTGLPKQPTKKPGYSQQQVNLSLAQNPNSTFGPSMSVNYGGLPGSPRPPLSIPGYTPDYAALIKGDPIYGQLRADLSADGISDAAARAAAVRRGLIQFGEVPDFNQLGGLNQQFLNEDVDGTTRQLAQANTDSGLSIFARQQKQYKDNLRAIKNALAARGALQSGETGHQLQEEQGRFDRAQYDSRQELLDYLAGVQQGFVAGERARRGQLAGGAEAAMLRQMQLNPAQGAQTVNPGDPGYPGAAPVAPSSPGVSAGSYSGSIGAYDNPTLSAEQRAAELANRLKRLGNIDF